MPVNGGVRAGSISVIGMPMPQGSKTAYPFKGRDGRTHVALTNGRTPQARSNFAAWRQAVSREASEWVKRNFMTPPIDGPVEMNIAFYLPRPKSLPKHIEYHTKKPDGDKCLRAVFDALTGIIFTDDARVYKFSVGKYYADGRPPGAEISWAAH